VHIRPALILAIFLFNLVAARGQEKTIWKSDVVHPIGFRFEAGAGFGGFMYNDGLSGRFATEVFFKGWGGSFRRTFHEGKIGDDAGWFGPPREVMNESAWMASKVILGKRKAHLLVSAGTSIVKARLLNEARTSLELKPTAKGFAAEVELATYGSVGGTSLTLMTALNSRTNLFALILSVTLGGM
jgi:hypothetical protein